MSYFYRKLVYQCRAVWCKHKNIVWERVDSRDGTVVTAVAWRWRCGGCGRGSFDLTYQKSFKRD